MGKERDVGQVKELQRELDDVSRQRDEMGASKEAERKARSLEGDINPLQDEHIAAERQRKELAEKTAWLASNRGNALDEKRRLESKIQQLQKHVEEERSFVSQFQEKSHKSQQQVDTLTTDLATERSITQKLDNDRLMMERQNRDLQQKLQDFEETQKSRMRTIQGLEQKLNQQANVYKEQVDIYKHRLKAQKRQLEETEEEVTRVNASKRKLQRELDDVTEQNDTLQREVTTLRSEARGGGGRSAPS